MSQLASLPNALPQLRRSPVSPKSTFAVMKVQNANCGATSMPSGQKLRYFAVMPVVSMAANRQVSALAELGS